MFENIKKNFGFGCMRLPLLENGDVDHGQVCQMFDEFMASGFNYFDTAHGYIDGKSEIAIRECLVKRYPRESFVLTNKLSAPFFKSGQEIRPLFEKQLEICGVKYFDIYLMHALAKKRYEFLKECKAFEQALEFKKEGKIKHIGISFHDTAEVLEQILTEYPQIEVVQLQFNYIDYEDPAVQSKKCYDVCVKYGKPVIVMEPVKGGHLVNIPEEGKKVFENLGGGSAASYAIRFAAGFENIKMVLSGMSNMAQTLDNLSFMKEFKPLNKDEMDAVKKVVQIIKSKNIVACTACRYCESGCPKKISIPDLFACLNTKAMYNDWNAEYYYGLHTQHGGKAGDCVKCGKCEEICPQKLPIRNLLEKVSESFDGSQETGD